MKIKECPFDGASASVVEVKADRDSDCGFGFSTYRVECDKCDACGPNGGTFVEGQAEAIKLWNKRV